MPREAGGGDMSTRRRLLSLVSMASHDRRRLIPKSQRRVAKRMLVLTDLTALLWLGGS